MSSNDPAVRWLKSYWDEEDMWLFFEVDVGGWVIRQIQLAGPEQTPKAAASRMDKNCNTASYAAKYGGVADQPITAWDPGWPHEEISREEFEQLWKRARVHLEKAE